MCSIFIDKDFFLHDFFNRQEKEMIFIKKE